MGDVKHHVTLRASRGYARVYLVCECGWVGQLPPDPTPAVAAVAAQDHAGAWASVSTRPDEDPAWYFTFGVDYDLSDAYVVVRAPTEHLARVRFLREREAVGLVAQRGWASVYDEVGFREVEGRYGPFREVPITTPAVPHAEVDG